jgi:hypothetical protein
MFKFNKEMHMKNKLLGSLIAALLISNTLAADDNQSQRLDAMEKEIASLKSELSTKSNNDNLKWGVDFRTSADNLHYKTADGQTVKNNALLSNRLWLNMNSGVMKKNSG